MDHNPVSLSLTGHADLPPCGRNYHLLLRTGLIKDWLVKDFIALKFGINIG